MTTTPSNGHEVDTATIIRTITALIMTLVRIWTVAVLLTTNKHDELLLVPTVLGPAFGNPVAGSF